jgi:hypothetical protein
MPKKSKAEKAAQIQTGYINVDLEMIWYKADEVRERAVMKERSIKIVKTKISKHYVKQ